MTDKESESYYKSTFRRIDEVRACHSSQVEAGSADRQGDPEVVRAISVTSEDGKDIQKSSARMLLRLFLLLCLVGVPLQPLHAALCSLARYINRAKHNQRQCNSNKEE